MALVLPEVSKELSIRTISEGTVLYRAHNVAVRPIWFGPGEGKSPLYRFDAPDGSFQVCYLGLTEGAAFVEGVVHGAIPRRVISGTILADRAISEVRVVEKIRAARLYGKYLIATGATAEVAHGAPYQTVSRPWAKAIHDHADQVDGIMYSARHDDSERALVLFDRARHKIREGAR